MSRFIFFSREQTTTPTTIFRTFCRPQGRNDEWWALRGDEREKKIVAGKALAGGKQIVRGLSLNCSHTLIALFLCFFGKK